MSAIPAGRHQAPGPYEIRLKGHLDSRWAAWFDGLSITHEQRRHHPHPRPGSRPGRAVWLAPEDPRHGPAAGLGHPGRARPARRPPPPDRREPANASITKRKTDMATTVQTPARNHAKRVPMDPTQEDRARRGHLLPDHLRLDPHTRPLQPGEGPRTASSAPAATPARSGAASSRSSSPSPASAPPSRCTRWSSGRTKASRSASSPPAPLKPPCSSPVSSSLLSLVTLHQDLGAAAGADAASLVTTGASHVATYNWAFMLGQSLMPGINAMLLGTLLYRSGLVPRVLPVIGLIGAPLHLTAVVATMFGVVIGHIAACAAIADTPGRCLGVLAGRLSDRQGLQALPHHRCHGREEATPPAYREVAV